MGSQVYSCLIQNLWLILWVVSLVLLGIELCGGIAAGSSYTGITVFHWCCIDGNNSRDLKNAIISPNHNIIIKRNEIECHPSPMINLLWSMSCHPSLGIHQYALVIQIILWSLSGWNPFLVIHCRWQSLNGWDPFPAMIHLLPQSITACEPVGSCHLFAPCVWSHTYGCSILWLILYLRTLSKGYYCWPPYCPPSIDSALQSNNTSCDISSSRTKYPLMDLPL